MSFNVKGVVLVITVDFHMMMVAVVEVDGTTEEGMTDGMIEGVMTDVTETMTDVTVTVIMTEEMMIEDVVATKQKLCFFATPLNSGLQYTLFDNVRPLINLLP
eukprot:m.124834 g.124834  ORF g.124834 m.124834 type:complete len:103 (-) comp14481_c0_seq13:43-351(-)